MKAWLVVLLLCAGFAGGQQKPAFDVVSIRRSDTAATNESIKALPGGHGYTAHNVAVTLIVQPDVQGADAADFGWAGVAGE